RGIFARVDAASRRHSERVDGVLDHGDSRVGATARGHRGVAELRRVRRLPALGRRGRTLVARLPFRPPEGRPPLPSRAAAQLQPQVLPALAAAVLLLRAVGRPAARGPRLSAGGVAPHSTWPVGAYTGPRRSVRRAVVLLAATVAAATAAWAAAGASTADWPGF